MILYAPDERIPNVDTDNEESANAALAVMGMTPVGTLEEKTRTLVNMGFVER